MGVFSFCLLGELKKLLHIRTDICLALRELSHNLLLFFSVRGKEIERKGLALEEIGHQDESIEGGSDAVGALEGLRDEAEDVVDGYEGFLGGSRTGLI